MSYREGLLEVTSQERAVPLGEKRKRGRPKALGNCLLKSPPLTRAPASPPSCPDSPALTRVPACPPSPASCPNSPPAIVQPLASPTLAADPGTPPPSVAESTSTAAPTPVYSPARRKSKQKRKPETPKKTKRTVVSTLRKSPVKRKATSPVKSSPRKLRPRK